MKRLIITYNQSCNLKCQFCYIDFHYKKVNDRVAEAVKKAAELNFEVITFGGGDPFSKKSFRDACIQAKESNLFVHVDTNTKAIREKDFNFIHTNIDLLGISIDAIGQDYDEFRGAKELFEHVDNVITGLSNYSPIKIKINTIVTKENVNKLLAISDYISNRKSIVRWSLYQFFPLSIAALNKKRYEISDDDFALATENIVPSNSNIQVEKFKFSDRVNGYLFCDEEGNLYTNNIQGEYIKLFSIFELDLEKKMGKIKELINPLTLNRYQ
jgi:MoaA/NifB/PqqE/SkfB family radical SAM enzyme